MKKSKEGKVLVGDESVNKKCSGMVWMNVKLVRATKCGLPSVTTLQLELELELAGCGCG